MRAQRRAAVLLAAGFCSLGVTACANVIGIEDPNSDLCHQYCDLIINECDGPNVAQFIGHTPDTKKGEDGVAISPYEQQTQCLAYCGVLLTTPGGQEPQGNTIACRIGLLESREQAADQAQKCEDAGPGSKVCSDAPGDPADPAAARDKVCATYCELYEGQCGMGPPQSPCDCLRQDGSEIPVGNGSYTIGSSGDTLYCRIYHTTVAMVETPAVHCSHAGIDSAMDVCAAAAVDHGGHGASGGTGGTGGTGGGGNANGGSGS